MTSILGYLQMIKSESTTPEERAEYLAIVESRAHALKALVTGFYDLSCLEAGGYALAQESVALAPLLVELAAAFYADFNADGREAEIDIAEGLSPILGDPQAVLRIYTNLFQNAIKHGAGDLYIRAFQEDGVVVTCFTNLAPGLLPQDVEHLFDRFFTADRMRTGQDTGLGLAIVHRLAMQMGGAKPRPCCSRTSSPSPSAGRRSSRPRDGVSTLWRTDGAADRNRRPARPYSALRLRISCSESG